MNLSNRTVLLTGGATGIGFALAERLHRRGCTLLLCGRRADRLAAAAAALPGAHTFVCDVADAAQREALVAWATTNHPALDVLVNNAGIQNRLRFDVPGADWSSCPPP